MDRVDALLGEYRRQLSLPWRPDLSGAERVWMAVYPPELERRVRAKLPDFDFATRESGHAWLLHDVTASFSTWLAAQEYRDAYYADPEALAPQSLIRSQGDSAERLPVVRDEGSELRLGLYELVGQDEAKGWRLGSAGKALTAEAPRHG